MRVSSILTFVVVALAAACGKGSVDPQVGEVSIVLTDAASDELDAFEVDVRNIVFTKANGSTVSVMPRATRVDFTELETLGELVAGGSLEVGAYARIHMTLDFSNAVVCIAGQTTSATVRDKNGVAITGTLPVQVDFAVGARPVVSVARRHLFAFDLDLDQSITVNAGANEVTFCPALHAEIDPENPKPVATTGLVTSVDTGASTFVVERRAVDGAALALFTVAVATTTVFQLNGVVAVGATGLASLSALVGTRVYVQGTLDTVARVVRAGAIEGGAGVPGNGQDWVLGHVVARNNGAGSDATLTVLGRSFDVATATRRFNTLHAVDVARATTKVLRRGDGNTLTSDAINVGQLVWVFGDLSGTTLDATAVDGVARLLRTSVFGIASGPAVANRLTLDVVRFDLRAVAAFDFTVAGVSQADPDAFTVDVRGLATAGIQSGDRLRVFGWINQVGVVGDADCTGLSFVDRGNEGRVLLCQWSPASAAAIVATTATSITFDITGTVVAAVGDGFAPAAFQPTPLPQLQPLLVAGIYRIVQDGAVELHFGFDAFRQTVAARAVASPVFRIAALGTWDVSTQVLRALVVTVVFD